MSKAPSSRQRMWNAMRMLQRFNVTNIATTSSVSISVARAYINSLQATGYLKVVTTHGGAGRYATYQLIRNTGPNYPSINRAQVAMDRNNGEFHIPNTPAGEVIKKWLKEAEEFEAQK